LISVYNLNLANKIDSVKVSIIIPCKNEEKYIEKCVRSILNSNYPKELISIYVCDGLSDDKTVEIVTRLSKEHSQVHLLINKAQTTPQGLNLGLKTAKSQVKIILGAHSEVDLNFLRENINILEKHPEVGCAGGIIENVYENKTSEIIGLAMASQFGVGNAHFRTGAKSGIVDTVAFGAYRAEVFDKIGYFDEDLVRNQDDEFNYRLIKNGFKIFLSLKVISLYYVRASYKKLFKQYYQYGYWKVFVNKKHSTVTSVRQLIPLFFVLFLISGAIGSFLSSYLLILSAAVLFIYFLLAAIFASKISPKTTYTPLIISVFLILHISYGFGYLRGLINFIILNKQPAKKSMELSR